MKHQYKQWLTLLCVILLVVNIGSVGAKYITTIRDDINFQVQAAGYTVIFHLQGGSYNGSTASVSKTQLGNKVFDTLPKDDIKANGMANVEFLGWSYDPGAKKVDVEADDPITVSQPLTELYAIWGFHMDYETNYENGIGDLTAIDENNMVIDITTNTATYERIFIPLKNLDPNYYYRISFDYSGSGEYHHYTRDYSTGRGFFGYHVIDNATKQDYKKTIEPLEYNPNGFNHFIDNDAPDQKFNFTDDHHSDIFVPNGETMYLYLEYSDVKDFTLSYHYINNLTIEKVAPKEQCTTVTHTGGSGHILYDKYIAVDDGYYSFKMRSESGQYERFGFEIPMEFTVGTQYTVSFDFKNSAISGSYASSYFGFAVDSNNSCLNSHAHSQYQGTFEELTMNDYKNGSSYSYTFTADSETMYMLYEISRGKDGNTARYEISNFNVVEESSTYEIQTAEGIQLDSKGISDNLECYLADPQMQHPVPGTDYGLIFEVKTGYTLAPTITVEIDGEIYEISTDGSGNEEGKPSFDPSTGTLTIPGALLKEDTQSVSIKADAVLSDVSEPSESTDPSESSEPTDPSEPSEPTDPSEPSEPTDPSVPSEPTDPSVPSEPTDPSVPSEPTDPSEPSEPTDPSESSEPTDPSVPSEPTESSEPSDPTDPSKDSTPTDPTENQNTKSAAQTTQPTLPSESEVTLPVQESE